MDNNQSNFNENNTYGTNGDNLFAETQNDSAKFSIASLVLGIVSIVCCCIPYYIPILISAMAIIFSILHKKNTGSFNGMAIAGLICGIIGLALGVADLLASAFFAPELDELAKQYNDLYNSLQNVA